MRPDQWLALLLIALMMSAFVWGRFRYDVVAAAALVAGVALGLVPIDRAFIGFSDDIVIIVGSALVVSAAISRSGVMDLLLRRLPMEAASPRLQLVALVAIVAVLSAFVKNIGALAIMMPVAVRLARKSGVSPSLFLMPMSFGSLLGGLMTEIGTSPNIIVSKLRADIVGSPFTMFDYTPVGAALTVAGTALLAVCYRLLPARQAESSMADATRITNYTTEATVPAGAAAVGQTVSWLQKPSGGQAMIIGILSSGGPKRKPLPDALIAAEDVLLFEGEQEALDKIVSQGGLVLSTPPGPDRSVNDLGVVEAVVGQQSRLIGLSARDLALFDTTGSSLLAVSRRGQRLSERLGEIKIRHGDVILLQGDIRRLPDILRDLDCLPLVEREVRLGSARNVILPTAILLAAMIATAIGVVPVAVAFFTAALLMVATGALPLRDVYGSLDAPILLMLAALIPVSATLEGTGTTDVLAGYLSFAAAQLPVWGALALILVAAMAVTPFLNNAATVLVMAPIAATFADRLGFRPDAFLMAVAIGAGSDFLTPIGHQCNTLVMGPGGYRFGDYWRLGLPLSLMVVAVSVPMLLWVWPP